MPYRPGDEMLRRRSSSCDSTKLEGSLEEGGAGESSHGDFALFHTGKGEFGSFDSDDSSTGEKHSIAG